MVRRPGVQVEACAGRPVTGMRRIRGVAARLDQFSEDGRKLVSAGAVLDGDRKPVLALPADVDRGGHGGSVIVGWCRFAVDEDLLILTMAGEITSPGEGGVDVPPGRYRCGLDARVGRLQELGPGSVVFESWTPIGVTVHLGAGRNVFANLEELEVFDDA
jgi:hypothetical protein